MRIGIVVEYLHGRGGTQRQALELARALVELGNEVIVLARVLDRSRCFPELLAGLDVRAVHELGEQSADPRRPRQTARRVAEHIGIHDAVSLATMRKSTRELDALLLRVLRERPLDVLNAHDYGPAAWSVATARGPTKVWQCNDPIHRWGAAPGVLGGVTRAAVVAYDQRRSAGFHCITVLDHAVARVVQKRFRVEPRVVRSGVDVDGFAKLPTRADARRRLGLAPDAFVVLLLSLLHSEHRRAEDAVSLIERLPDDTRLLFAATVVDPESHYTRLIERRIASSPAKDRVVWRRSALRDENELRDLYAGADVFYFPNERQTWGLAVMEACAAGLPVIVSRGAGAHEVITDGTTGYVYPVGDVERAAERVMALRDPEARRRMGDAGRVLASSMRWQDYARGMLAAFDDARTRRKV